MRENGTKFPAKRSCSTPRCIGRERLKICPAIIYIAILFLFMAIGVAQSQGLLKGNLEKCDIEGEIKEIPSLVYTPCITCMCKNGSIRCKQEVCPARYDCTYLINQPGKCCRKCLGCSYHEQRYQSNEMWQDNTQGTCHDHVCQDGVVTRSPLQCHVTCENPIVPPSGTCGCPSCRDCVHMGLPVEEGATYKIDACTECVCEAGNTICKKITCPVLVCEKHQQQMSSDGCCMTCTGQRLLYKLDNGGCWFKRGFLENLETIPIDKCTSCTCRNGTIICDRQTCPSTLNCPQEERIHDQCCPRCPKTMPSNCTDEKGDVFRHGENWQEPRDPCLTCQCQNGVITCERENCPSSSVTCPQGQTIDKIPGSCCATCTPQPGICAVFGDPHYRTFDGLPFNFQGDCKYMLAKDCLERNFTVVVENNAKQSPHFSWTNTIHLRLIMPTPAEETVVSLYQHLAVKVNREKVSLPFVNSAVLIWMEHQMVKVRTNAGVSLNWDGDSFLEVGASSQHRGALCGLCGNFNGFPRDDFIGGDGVFKFDEEDFAESWRVGADEGHCTRREIETRSPEPCANNLRSKVAARKQCQIFKSKEFRRCYSEVDPMDYYRSCLTDACECPRNRKCSCESIRAYTSACDRQGVTITWEESRYCPQTCSHGKVYSTCGSPCKVNCKNYRRLRRRDTCRRHCVAGCYCPAGYVTQGRKCVKISKCSAIRSRRLKNKYRHINPFQRLLISAGRSERRNRRRSGRENSQRRKNA